MVGHGAVLREIGAVVRFVAAKQCNRALNNWRKYVGVVVRFHALQHHCHALQAHAGIDRRARQRLHGRAVELHKHVVPDLDIVGIIAVHAVRGHLAQVVTQVNGDLRARPARPGVAHYPEIIFAAKAQHAARVGARRDPELLGFFVWPEAPLVVAGKHREPQALDWQLKRLGQQVPCHADRLALEIIAKRKIAQHFKESLVARRRPNFLKVVVLARDAHALLCRHSARVRALLKAQKGVFELHHPRVRKQQRWVIPRYQRRTRHNGMPALLKKL